MATPTINGVAPNTEQLAALHTAASMKAGFDASSAQDKAAFQASVSGAVGTLITGRYVALGDSNTEASDVAATARKGVSWPTYAQFLGGGKIYFVRNAGIAGNKIQHMIDRIATDVAPYSAGGDVVICAGTNNADDYNLTLFKSKFDELVSKVNAVCQNVPLTLLPPRSNRGSTGLAKHRVRLFNEYIKLKAQKENRKLIDQNRKLIDVATGSIAAAYQNGVDDVHFNALGYYTWGAEAAAVLSGGITDPGAIMLTTSSADEINMIYNGCFATNTGSSAPAGWYDNAGVTGSTISYTTSSGIAGKAVRITSTAGADNRQLAYALRIGADVVAAGGIAANASTVSTTKRADYRGIIYFDDGTEEFQRIASSTGSGPYTNTLEVNTAFAHAAGSAMTLNAQPGDVLFMSALVSTDGGCEWSLDAYCWGASSAQNPTMAAGLPPGIPLTAAACGTVFTVPAGTNEIDLRFTVKAGNGWVEAGQIGIFNLTRMGLV